MIRRKLPKVADFLFLLFSLSTLQNFTNAPMGLAQSLSLLSSSAGRTTTRGPLRVCRENPRYFTDGSGRAILLVGSHTWATLQDIGTAPVSPFDWNGFLNLLESHNHNFMRNWTWEQAAWAPWTSDKILFLPTIYQRTGPGTGLDNEPKFDLTKFNPEFFERLRSRIIQAGERGIYVSVMFFQGFSFLKPFHHCDPWPGHPYNERNNINGFNGDLDRDSVIDLHRPEVREMQAAYIRKVVDTVNDLDNVLYEAINEGGTKEWEGWVVDTIHKYEAGKPKQHPVGVTGAGKQSLDDMLANSRCKNRFLGKLHFLVSVRASAEPAEGWCIRLGRAFEPAA
ncbi:MAG: DUF6298 domain-containing protein, partial [Acidobacteriota bacterium]